jgi:hypothetical protein
MEKDDKDWIGVGPVRSGLSALGSLPVGQAPAPLSDEVREARAQRDAAYAERDAAIEDLRRVDELLKHAVADRVAVERELQTLHAEGRTSWESRDDDSVRVLVRRRIVDEVIGRVEASVMQELGVCYSYHVPEGERGSGSHTDPARDVATQMTAAQRLVELMSGVKP